MICKQCGESVKGGIVEAVHHPDSCAINSTINSTITLTPENILEEFKKTF